MSATKSLLRRALLRLQDRLLDRAGGAARARRRAAPPAPPTPPRKIMVCGVSRSGTTLLCTILDSHPLVAMGYELLPANLPPPEEMIDVLRDAGPDAAGLDQLGDRLRKSGARDFGMFLKRCARATLTARELAALLPGLGAADFRAFESRVRLSDAVVAAKQARQGAPIGGYKLNSGGFDEFHALHPEARFVLILRDPRDVLASQMIRRFPRTPEEILGSWLRYLLRFEKFQAAHPELCTVLRYEDLVADPQAVLRAACAAIGLSYDPQLLDFHRSKASVLAGGHVNSRELRQGFFASSVQRWRSTLDTRHIELVRRTCARAMRRHGYDPRLAAELDVISPSLVQAKRRQLAAKRAYQMHQYGPLVEMVGRGARNVTLAEMARRSGPADGAVFFIRHDIDHDLENALKIAAWEKERGLRATYCVLHSAWYYGARDRRGLRRYSWVLEACRALQDLGHEINLHNNFACEALRHGLDPYAELERELRFLRANGIEIVGTSTHGDALCRELDFRNYELFSESVYPSRGGARAVQYQGRSIGLGERSMAEFGLLYEAYDFPRDWYVTESGGKLREHRGTRGRAGKRRGEAEVYYDTIVGILTHPEWWGWDPAPAGAQPAPPPLAPAA